MHLEYFLLPFCRRNTASAASSSPDLSVQNRIAFALQLLKNQILPSAQQEKRKRNKSSKQIYKKKTLFKWKMVLTVEMFFAVKYLRLLRPLIQVFR